MAIPGAVQRRGADGAAKSSGGAEGFEASRRRGFEASRDYLLFWIVGAIQWAAFEG